MRELPEVHYVAARRCRGSLHIQATRESGVRTSAHDKNTVIDDRTRRAKHRGGQEAPRNRDKAHILRQRLGLRRRDSNARHFSTSQEGPHQCPNSSPRSGDLHLGLGGVVRGDRGELVEALRQVDERREGREHGGVAGLRAAQPGEVDRPEGVGDRGPRRAREPARAALLEQRGERPEMPRRDLGVPRVLRLLGERGLVVEETKAEALLILRHHEAAEAVGALVDDGVDARGGDGVRRVEARLGLQFGDEPHDRRRLVEHDDRLAGLGDDLERGDLAEHEPTGSFEGRELGTVLEPVLLVGHAGEREGEVDRFGAPLEVEVDGAVLGEGRRLGHGVE
mmetsp:Transcript_7140/g.29686  ORF Transcript_7140/g.29686 Transcript_7140/m.29686 type:complete len:337 (-) Transcript_7140:21-1031(-)